MDGTSSSVLRQSQTKSRRARIRVVGKIADDCHVEGSKPSDFSPISVTRSDGDHVTVSVSFNDKCPGSKHKSTYMLDWCYKEDGVAEIYTREINPMVQGLFNGNNSCVIAYGSQAGATQQIIQGSKENPGLVQNAMSEILELANEKGALIEVSSYEICQDNIYDSLEPKLKGLSKFPVKSMDEFKKVYFDGTERQQQKLPEGSPKGLIVYVTLTSKETKMNFLDLGIGYKDGQVDKLLYSIMKVVCALNQNESYVPYRENKLTRFLQDFQSSPSGSLVIACLNQTVTQDNVRALGLASRSCHVVNQIQYNSMKSCKSAPSSKKGNVTPCLLQKRLDPPRSSAKQVEQKLTKSLKENSSSDLDSTVVAQSEVNGMQNNNQIEKSLTVEGLVHGDDVVTDERSAIVDPINEDMDKDILDIDFGAALVTNTTTTTTTEGKTGVNNERSSPKISDALREISNSLKLLSMQSPRKTEFSYSLDPKTPIIEKNTNLQYPITPYDSSIPHSTGVKKSVVHECLTFLNSANKEELKKLKGIGERRATLILELREDDPEPFKNIEDLKEIGVSTKQFGKMVSSFIEDC